MAKKLLTYAANITKYGKVLKVYADGSAKNRAEGTRQEIIDGIRKGNLVTPGLKPSTIKLKIKNGMSHPKTPLLGTEGMLDLLKVRKLKTGYRLQPEGRHKPSGLPAKAIWSIHEFGCHISNGFGKGISITIPARFPFLRGLKRYNRKQGKEESRVQSKKLKQVLTGR